MKCDIRKHYQKKHFWFQAGDVNISDNFYKIEKFKYWPVFPIITTDLILSLIPGPLEDKTPWNRTTLVTEFYTLSKNVLVDSSSDMHGILACSSDMHGILACQSTI